MIGLPDSVRILLFSEATDCPARRIGMRKFRSTRRNLPAGSLDGPFVHPLPGRSLLGRRSRTPISPEL